MLPHLTPGQVVLAKVGAVAIESDVVCVRHPNMSETIMIKRVGFIEDDGRLFLRSDNSNAEGAVDSHRFGLIEPAAVVAVVTSVVGQN